MVKIDKKTKFVVFHNIKNIILSDNNELNFSLSELMSLAL